MLALKVPIKDAERVKEELIKKGLLAKNYQVKREGNFLYLPLLKKYKTPYEITDIVLKEYKHESNKLKPLLTTELTPEEMERVKTAFDIVGDIAILEIDRELQPKEKIIAELLLKSHKQIKTVVRKEGSHEGEFRTQKMKVLAGLDNKETIHRENGVRLKLHIEDVYYSPRLSTERKRIASMVKPGESVLVMFSGNAPYVCVLARNTQAKEIYGIEMNPKGHAYGLENLRLNHITNALLFCGDVREVMPTIQAERKVFDRIVMPLPKTAEQFLDSAFLCAKKGTTIHLYTFLKEDAVDAYVTDVKKQCKAAGYTMHLLKVHKCGQIKAKEFRMCIDFELK